VASNSNATDSFPYSKARRTGRAAPSCDGS
jgi:hypothetical protein